MIVYFSVLLANSFFHFSLFIFIQQQQLCETTCAVTCSVGPSLPVLLCPVAQILHNTRRAALKTVVNTTSGIQNRGVQMQHITITFDCLVANIAIFKLVLKTLRILLIYLQLLNNF